MKGYESLFKRHRDQPANQVFAFFHYKGAAGETWEAPFRRLAGMAKRGEDWNFVRPEFQRAGVNFPILTNYLNNTFCRLQGQVLSHAR